uniref:Uncharacterized protein n=1 Tax=Romanomermis culicivorax TaxID=13658 RepID=A0A915I591_ROMCU
MKKIKLNASNPRMINIQAILGSRVVQTKIVDEGACHEDLMAFRSCPISKLAKPNGYPRILGHPDKKMDKPKLKRYSPSSGAFMSEPFTLPWITYFKTNTNDTCIGILFSGDHYGSLYEIPVKIVRSKTSRGNAGQVVKTFTTERLYYKGNGNLGKRIKERGQMRGMETKKEDTETK